MANWNPKIKKALAKVAPDIVFSVAYERDHHFQWDGDGPDPSNEGFDAYDVDVYARTTVGGESVEGRASLGGTYAKPGEFDPDINGYLPQMLEEAVQELMKSDMKLPRSTMTQANAALVWLKHYMRKSYERQQRKK